jgi:hypothetical protein
MWSMLVDLTDHRSYNDDELVHYLIIRNKTNTISLAVGINTDTSIMISEAPEN